VRPVLAISQTNLQLGLAIPMTIGTVFGRSTSSCTATGPGNQVQGLVSGSVVSPERSGAGRTAEKLFGILPHPRKPRRKANGGGRDRKDHPVVEEPTKDQLYGRSPLGWLDG